ncbi:MAG: hypothetical protein ACR2K5_09675 [Pseudolabrys sp.]
MPYTVAPTPGKGAPGVGENIMTGLYPNDASLLDSAGNANIAVVDELLLFLQNVK